MAIAFDATANGSTAPGTSITFAHTCTGSNLVLWVGVTVNGSASETITGVTYNGVAMTQAKSQFSGDNQWVYLYYLIAPATGANNVVVSLGSSQFARAISASYTGAFQTGSPDGTNGNAVNPGTSLTTTITTVADLCWNVSFAANENGSALSASTGVSSVRGSVGNFASLGDSNSAKTPAGSYQMIWTSASQPMASVQASFAPFTASAATAGFLSTLAGVI